MTNDRAAFLLERRRRFLLRQLTLPYMGGQRAYFINEEIAALEHALAVLRSSPALLDKTTSA